MLTFVYTADLAETFANQEFGTRRQYGKKANLKTRVTEKTKHANFFRKTIISYSLIRFTICRCLSQVGSINKSL